MEDSIVPEYDSANPLIRWIFHWRLKVALSYVSALKPASLIDIGCGEGLFIEKLLDSKIPIDEIWGIDRNPRIIEAISLKYPDCSFNHYNFAGEPCPGQKHFQDGEFEVTVCLDTLEHIEKADEAIKEIRRLTADDGYLITSQPTENLFYKLCRFLAKGVFSAKSGPASGPHYHKAGQLHRLVRNNGFTRILGRSLPLPFPFDLFHINLYQKDGEGR